MQLSTPYGPVEFIPRDFAKMPRNYPSTRRTSVKLLRGVTVHYSGGEMEGYPSMGSTPFERDEAFVARTIRNHCARRKPDGTPEMSDVGYQLLVGRTGVCWEGRGLQWMNAANGDIRADARHEYPPGASTSNPWWQSIFLAVGIDPDHDDDFEHPTDVQWETTRRLVAYIAAEYSIDPCEVVGHRDVSPTACPGPYIYPRLRELIPNTLEDDMVSARVVITGDPNFTQFHISGGKVRHIPDVPTSQADAPLSGPEIKSLDRKALKLYEFAPTGGPFPPGFSQEDFGKP